MSGMAQSFRTPSKKTDAKLVCVFNISTLIPENRIELETRAASHFNIFFGKILGTNFHEGKIGWI